MKIFSYLFLALVGISLGWSQPADSTTSIPKRSSDDLQKLVSPIAIYPDSLVAIILPAATASSDIVLASRYLAANGDPSQFENQSWDPSVVALARYPEVVKWMDQNLEWTRQLGEAFANQPSDVMAAIQTLRSRAKQAGLLQSTPQQEVTMNAGEVYIEPTSPDVIYVPEYDPDIVYYCRPVAGPWLNFSVGFAAGAWLDYSCDWGRGGVYIYHHGPGWVYRPGWYWRNHGNVVATRPWHPSPRYWRYEQRAGARIAQHPVQHLERSHFTSAPNVQRSSPAGSSRVEQPRHEEHRAEEHRGDDRSHTSYNRSWQGQSGNVEAQRSASAGSQHVERVGSLSPRQNMVAPRVPDFVPRAAPAAHSAPPVQHSAAPVQHSAPAAQHYSAPAASQSSSSNRGSGGESHSQDNRH